MHFEIFSTHNLVAPLQVSAEDDFGVAAGFEPLAELRQLVAQLDEVVDLADVDERGDRPSLFLRLHRLRAAGKVNDGKTAMPKTDMPVDPHAARVRTAERHRFRHRCDDVLVCPEIAVVLDPASHAAHRVTLSNVISCGSTALSCLSSAA